MFDAVNASPKVGGFESYNGFESYTIPFRHGPGNGTAQNEPEKSFIFSVFLVGACVYTMKNTMFRNSR